jgi:hypothetical protein
MEMLMPHRSGHRNKACCRDISNAPLNRNVEVQKIDERGCFVVAFPCSRTDRGWINVLKDSPLSARTHSLARYAKLIDEVGTSVMNYSLLTTDHRTHLKIMIVTLIAAIVVAGVGIAGHLAGPETVAGGPSSVPVLKAGKLQTYTDRDSQLIR